MRRLLKRCIRTKNLSVLDHLVSEPGGAREYLRERSRVLKDEGVFRAALRTMQGLPHGTLHLTSGKRTNLVYRFGGARQYDDILRDTLTSEEIAIILEVLEEQPCSGL